MPGVRFVVRPGELRAIADSLPVSLKVKEVAETVVLPEIVSYLSRAHPALNKWGWAKKGFLNPPPGPPYRRTGDLVAGLRVVSRGRGHYAIDSTALHRGQFYGDILLHKGYQFLPPSLRARIV